MTSRSSSRATRIGGEVRFDYTTIGHVTVDVLADGSRRAGGSALYSGLQAARLGKRALIITRGAVSEVEELLEPYRGELDVEIVPAARTTTLETFEEEGGRTQRVRAWAGPIGEELSVDTSILHLAPVARETPRRWRGRAAFVGLTAQGLVRAWAEDGRIRHVPVDPRGLPARCDAIVISETERECCAGLVADAPGRRGFAASAIGSAGPAPRATGPREDPLVAITAAAAPTELRSHDGAVERVRVPAIADFRDDVGAGDVFAAAFFVASFEGRPAAAAAGFANAAAAVRIAGTGAGAIGDRTAIEARLRDSA